MNQERKDSLPFVFSIATLVMPTAFIIYHFVEKSERRQVLKAQKESTAKFVHVDVLQTNGIFQGIQKRALDPWMSKAGTS